MRAKNSRYVISVLRCWLKPALYRVGQKVGSVPHHPRHLVTYLSVTAFEVLWLNCHISVRLKEKLVRTVECVAIFILKMDEQK